MKSVNPCISYFRVGPDWQWWHLFSWALYWKCKFSVPILGLQNEDSESRLRNLCSNNSSNRFSSILKFEKHSGVNYIALISEISSYETWKMPFLYISQNLKSVQFY